jgi:endonuclease/exonuclease/phosphatase family metal-dependent hydrolase
MNLKIGWYNVLRGFHNKKPDGSFTFEPRRLEAARNVIRVMNPDILFIGEGDFNPLCKIKGPKIKTVDYKKEFGFPFVYYSKPDETSRKGEVILSRFPISVNNLSEKDMTHIKTWFNIDGKKINIDAIHPHPMVKDKEKAEWVSNIIDKSEEPYILLGDFNGLSPRDRYKFENLVEEFTAFQGSKEKAETNARDVLQCTMLKKVISRGLTDSYYVCNDKFSSTLPTKRYNMTKNKVGIRIDYIFCSKTIRVLKSGIVKNKLADMASDHYPIFAYVEIR